MKVEHIPLSTSPFSTLPEALVGDTRRQAPALFKGLDFQIWLTIAAWIDLEEEQILVIEGVEDFDVVNEDGGITTQVKALAQPISLRSTNVTDALRNFWQSKHSNAGRQVQYRFVTTASVATESGEPFGDKAAGLTLWSREAQIERPSETTEILRRFLIGDEAVRNRLNEELPANVPSLMDFLQNSNPEMVFREFIRPIRWLTDHLGVESAKAMVSEKLHAYGEKRYILAGDCDRALPHFFEFVAHKAFKEHRSLSREEFRLEFEKAVSPGPREMAQLQLVGAMARKFLEQGDTNSDSTLANVTALDVPRLPTFCLAREGLASLAKSSLTKTGFVALHGSTGKGKSTLAKLVIGNYAGAWKWFSFAGLDASGVAAQVNRVVSFAATTNSPCLVLDNFDMPSVDEPRFARRLATLFLLTTSRSGLIIITAQRPLPSIFLRETGLPVTVLQTISNLTKEEIQELCRQAGCSEERQLLAHAAIIVAQTGGHPLLVNAAVMTRREQDWPTPSADQILTQAPEIIEERKIAQQLLEARSDGEVELLSRLSLLSMSFRRDQAIAIGEIEPSVVHPGICFDKLVGPWIEPASGNRYRLSSLLSQIAMKNCSSHRIAELRGAIGRAILRSGNLTQSEASEILMDAVLIKDKALALPVLKALYLAPDKHRKFWADELWWMLAFTETKAMFPTDPMVTFLFHHVQFRLAVASNNDRALQLAEMLIDEVDGLKMAKNQEIMIAGAACDILLALKALISPKLLLRCWLKTISALASSDMVSEFARNIEQNRPSRFRMPKLIFSEMFFGFILCRRGGSDFMTQFLTAVNELEEKEREQVLAAIRANQLHLRYFIDQAWIEESAKPKPDWDKVIHAIQEMWDASKRWQFPEMIAMAARGISIINDEYLNLSDKALQVLDQGAKQIGSDIALLRQQRGYVFFHCDRYQDAYDQWVSVLPEMEKNNVESATDALFLYSKFADVAGRLSRWDESAKTFLEGRTIAQKVELRMEAIAFGVDAAHALWFGGRRSESLTLFAKCIDELEVVQSGKSEPDGFHTLWKVTEQIVRWCSMNAGAHDETYELKRVGLCTESKDEERHKLIKNIPRSPAALVWMFLAEAELYAGPDRTIYNKTISRPDGSTYVGTRTIRALLVHRRAFRDHEFSSLPIMVEEMAIAGAIATGKSSQEFFSYCPNPQIPQDINLNICKFADYDFPAAILSLAADGKDWQSTISKWRKSAKHAVTKFDFETLFNRIETVMKFSSIEAGNFYKSAENQFDRLLGSIRLATLPDSELSACFVGCVSLVTDASLKKGYMGEGDALGVLIRDIWRKRLNFRAEFNSPRSSVPAIEAACNQPFKGAKLAAHILLAAQCAVHTRVPESVLMTMRQLADAPV